MKKYRIAIVENDPDEQLFIREGFEESGLFDLLHVYLNGDLLIDWLASNPSPVPDIILSDLNMPGKNGYDVLNFVKSSSDYRNLPVIITSTSTAQAVKEKCLAHGAAEYLVKPETFMDYKPFAENLYTLIERRFG